MAKNKKGGGLSSDDVKEWERVVRSIKVYTGKKIHQAVEEAPADPSNLRYLPNITEFFASPPKAPAPLKPLSMGDLTPLDKSTAAKFRKGALKLEARLDLHGMRQDEASAALYAFIRRSYEAGRRCILVITGKGRKGEQGVLHQNVPRWLAMPGMRECIVAATYAQPKDGGEGALYLFIRRIRRSA
jgi:DNA-nicking Smr family endonuclease